MRYMKCRNVHTAGGTTKARVLRGNVTKEVCMMDSVSTGESEVGGYFIRYLSHLNIGHINLRGKIH